LKHKEKQRSFIEAKVRKTAADTPWSDDPGTELTSDRKMGTGVVVEKDRLG
jgi:hypothetical protein